MSAGAKKHKEKERKRSKERKKERNKEREREREKGEQSKVNGFFSLSSVKIRDRINCPAQKLSRGKKFQAP